MKTILCVNKNLTASSTRNMSKSKQGFVIACQEMTFKDKVDPSPFCIERSCEVQSSL